MADRRVDLRIDCLVLRYMVEPNERLTVRAKNTKVFHVDDWKHGWIQHPGDSVHSVGHICYQRAACCELSPTHICWEGGAGVQLTPWAFAIEYKYWSNRAAEAGRVESALRT